MSLQIASEAAMAAALADPSRNLHATYGPQCLPCSGLGSVLRIGSEGAPTRYATRCSCGGSGVDIQAIQRLQIGQLIARLEAMEQEHIAQAKQWNQILKQLGTTKRGTPKMSRQSWAELISWATADGTAVANTTTETIIMPNVTVPASYMQDGRALKLTAQGKHSTLGSGTVTLTFRIRWGGVGGTVLALSGAITQVISLTNALWEIKAVIQTRSNGSSGTLMVNGTAIVYGAVAPTIGSATGAPAVAPLTVGGQTAPAVATVDLTTDTALALTLTHGAASSSNSAQGLAYWLESKN